MYIQYTIDHIFVFLFWSIKFRDSMSRLMRQVSHSAHILRFLGLSTWDATDDFDGPFWVM